MMPQVGVFCEKNSVQDYVIDLISDNGWRFVTPETLPRQPTDILVESYLKAALIKLNPEIREKPDKADEVIYKLRAILLSVQADGLVRANEEFTAWLRGERSMPFGKNNEHVTVKLIDFDNIENNDFVVTEEYSVTQKVTKRPDIVLLVNGIPLVVGETKTPVRPATSWVDAAADIHDDYEVNIPALFVPNVFSFGTEGKEYRFGSIRAPLDVWAPWRNNTENKTTKLKDLEFATKAMLQPVIILDILNNFTIFATDRKKRKIKIICRHQQYEAANLIVDRVKEGTPKKGLIWHFQGSGKSLLMLFAAQKLRMAQELKSPTVLIVVDRIDLDTQITATFNAADVPNTVPTDKIEELKEMLEKDIRKIIITTIFKFKECKGILNSRDNIIVLVDEAHRTQEGDLGLRMRTALPNAFFFGLTGTPINRRDRNTFATFGAEMDDAGYLSRYSFEESIRDNATLPLHFEPRLVEMHVDKETINNEIANLTDQISEEDKAELSKRAGRMSTIVRNPERIGKITKDIIEHYQNNVEPNGFKAMVVCYDRHSCVDYKTSFDELLPPEYTDIVMTVGKGDPQDWKTRWSRKKDEEEKILDRFRDPKDPLQMIIVTAKLLTGFDAPILQAMYLDKVLKDHTLLQAICRVNRPFPQKTHGLIVDYIGVFDDVAQSITFDEENIRQAIRGINELFDKLPSTIEQCLSYFKGLDRSISGYEGLIAAQECLPNNEMRDKFALDYSFLSKLWEAISPNPILLPHKENYRWLTQVYESVQPPSGNGKLIWRALGAKTIQIINENIHVETIRDDLDKIILDESMIRDLMENDKNAHKVIEIKIFRRLSKYRGNPKFIELGRKLEELKDKYEQHFLNSLDYLKELLKLAKEVLKAEKEVDTVDERKKAKAALTDLFQETKTKATPVMIERIVNDIDEVVRVVRFDGWQWTKAGEKEIKHALRKTLLKYNLHKEQELFDRAYEYIREYY
jgi:type I restriction enzyme, R subunit